MSPFVSTGSLTLRRAERSPLKPSGVDVVHFCGAPLATKIKIGVLTANDESENVPALREAAERKGAELIAINPEKCVLFLDPGKRNPFQVFYDQQPLSDLDVLLARLTVSYPKSLYAAAVEDHVKYSGVPVVNDAEAVQTVGNKFKTHQVLADAHIPMFPVSTAVRSKDEVFARALIEAAPDKFIVLKNYEGFAGSGVSRGKVNPYKRGGQKSIHTLYNARQGKQTPAFFQPYSYGSEENRRLVDYRCFVVGDKVIASERRLAKKGAFLTVMGDKFPYDAPPLLRHYAVAAMRALRLDVGTVDFVNAKETKAGEDEWLLLEVNSCPDIVKIQQRTNVPVSDIVIDFLITEAESRKFAKAR